MVADVMTTIRRTTACTRGAKRRMSCSRSWLSSRRDEPAATFVMGETSTDPAQGSRAALSAHVSCHRELDDALVGKEGVGSALIAYASMAAASYVMATPPLLYWLKSAAGTPLPSAVDVILVAAPRAAPDDNRVPPSTPARWTP